MAKPRLGEKDVLTIGEAIEYWGFSYALFYQYLRKVDKADYLVYYRNRKLILRVEFEKYLFRNLDLKGELTYGKSWKRTNKARF